MPAGVRLEDSTLAAGVRPAGSDLGSRRYLPMKAASCFGSATLTQREEWSLGPITLGTFLAKLIARPAVWLVPKVIPSSAPLEPESDGRVPAVGAGDLGVVDVRDRGLDAPATIGGSQHPVSGDCNSVCVLDAKQDEQTFPSVVESVREEALLTTRTIADHV